MREGGDCFGLPLEPREGVGVRGQVRRKDLDGDVPVELAVPRPVDFSHTPGADRPEDLVGAQACFRG